MIVSVLGVADRVKSGGGRTARKIVAECTRLPLVPVTVTVKVPSAAVAFAVKVRVEETAPLRGGVAGLTL